MLVNGATEMASIIKLTVVLPSIGGGGAEQHMLRVVNHLDPTFFAVTLAACRPGGAYEDRVRQEVRVVHLTRGFHWSRMAETIFAFLPLRRLLRSDPPDLVCSVLDHITVMTERANCCAPRARCVFGLQNPVSQHFRSDAPLESRLLRGRLPKAFEAAEAIVSLSKGVAEDFRSHFPRLASKCRVIYNAGVDDDLYRLAKEPLNEPLPGKPLVVACGRLAPQKGFDSLLRAFAQVRKLKDATLWILGEGELRHMLVRLTDELGLNDHVRFLGFQRNPFKYLAAATVFALSSRFEGFGNVIVEAMACGLPVVATNCPYGPAEIIQPGISGLLVPIDDDAALANALIQVLEDSVLRQRLTTGGQARARDFRAQEIGRQYAELFAGLSEKATDRRKQ